MSQSSSEHHELTSDGDQDGANSWNVRAPRQHSDYSFLKAEDLIRGYKPWRLDPNFLTWLDPAKYASASKAILSYKDLAGGQWRHRRGDFSAIRSVLARGGSVTSGGDQQTDDVNAGSDEEPTSAPPTHAYSPPPTLASDTSESRPPAGTATAGGLVLALGAGGAGSLMTGALTGIETGAISGFALGAAPLVAGAGTAYLLAHPELGRTPVAVQSHPELSGAVTRFSGADFTTQEGAIGEVRLNVRGAAGAPDRGLGGFWVDGGSGLRYGTDGPVLGSVGFEAIKLNADGETKLRELLQSDPRSRAAGLPNTAPATQPSSAMVGERAAGTAEEPISLPTTVFSRKSRSGADLPRGLMGLEKRGEEWGRRHGYGAEAGKDAAHKVKQSREKRGGGRKDYSIDPETGDVYDPDGEYVGNAGDYIGEALKGRNPRDRRR